MKPSAPRKMAAARFLDHKHHIGAASVIFVKNQSHIVLQRPRQNAVLKFSNLLAVFQNDGVFADQVDTGYVAIEIDANCGPVEARADLFNVG